MLLRLDNRGEWLAELLPTQIVALPIIFPLRQVMRVGRVIGLGGGVTAHVVGGADDADVTGVDADAVGSRRGLHLPDRVLGVHRAAVVRVRVAVLHVSHVHACCQRHTN
jgi:hypothetical protein